LGPGVESLDRQWRKAYARRQSPVQAIPRIGRAEKIYASTN